MSDENGEMLDILNIDHGVPESRTNWPQDVLHALERYSQGHVVEGPPFFYCADLRWPIWARSMAYATDSQEIEIVEAGPQAEPKYGIITTQTCDIIEEGKSKLIYPWIQVAPIYNRSDLNSGMRDLLAAGKGPKHLYHIPALPDGFWVADFRIEVPVEKGWLTGRSPIEGFGDEELQERVGRRLADLRCRPAFAGAFVEAVQRPLGSTLRELKKSDTHLYNRVCNQIDEIAVRLDSNLNPTHAQVIAITTSEAGEDVKNWFSNWWDDTRPKAAGLGITLLAPEFRLEVDIMLAEYRRMTIMPVDRASPE